MLRPLISVEAPVEDRSILSFTYPEDRFAEEASSSITKKLYMENSDYLDARTCDTLLFSSE